MRALTLVLAAILLAPAHLPARADGKAPTDGEVPAVVLDQGLSEEERRRFYHLSVGSQLLPLGVLRALQDPETGRPFLDNPERFGMLPDPDDPDGLPVGLTHEMGRGSSVLGPIAGINCAACHVTELRHDGGSVRIDGAPSMVDFERFSAELSKAMDALKSPGAMAGFLKRIVLQPDPSPPLEPKTPEALSGVSGVDAPPEDDGLAPSLRERLAGWAARVEQSRRLFGGKLEFLGRVGRMESGHPAGPGRTDDWVLARNLLFPEETWLPRGVAAASYPAIWGYDRYDWLTWNGATRSGMERGVATVLGLGALYDEQYESTVSPAGIVEHDRIAARIEPPEWPEDVLGPIDRALASRGEAIYQAECARCHDQPAAFSHDEIGTDRTHAASFATPLYEKDFRGAFSAPGKPAFAEALSNEIAKFTAFAYADEGWTDRQIEIVAPTENEVWKPVMQVVSRPLDAVWATAPYLSNGSVPTLEALLTPPEERPKAFPVGHYDYDPVALGYRTDVPRDEAVFWFDATLAGNSAAGHDYGTRLAADDRRALIEYLKSR